MTGFDFGFFLWGMGPGVNLLVKRAKGVVDGGVSPVVDFKPAARQIRIHSSGLTYFHLKSYKTYKFLNTG